MIAQKEWLSRIASLSTANPSDTTLQAEERFCDLLQIETKRAQRSLRPLLLMLLDLCEVENWGQKQKAVRGIAPGLFSSTREIDIKGWFGEGSAIGVLFREIGGDQDSSLARKAIIRRMLPILDAAAVPHSAVSWHLLSPSAVGRQGAGQERLETLQRAVQAVAQRPEREILKNERPSSVAGALAFSRLSTLDGRAAPGRKAKLTAGVDSKF